MHYISCTINIRCLNFEYKINVFTLLEPKTENCQVDDESNHVSHKDENAQIERSYNSGNPNYIVLFYWLVVVQQFIITTIILWKKYDDEKYEQFLKVSR